MNICESRDDLYLIIILIIWWSIAREIPKNPSLNSDWQKLKTKFFWKILS